MKCHGLMLVRDEADVLPESIPHYLRWMDALYVMDLGSTDETWQVLTELAAGEPRLVLHDRKPIIFHEGLRAILFDAYRRRFSDGDWIVKADADEFYDVPPPEFARKHLRAGETCVYLQWYYFRLTSADLATMEPGENGKQAERRRPVAERRRYYKLPEHAEPRMFRYRHSMQWPETAAFPYNAGYVARARIPVRHYPHRDPWQMAKRYRLRAAMNAIGGSVGGAHWNIDDWRRDVVLLEAGTGQSSEQNDGVGLGAVAGHTSGALRYWQDGDRVAESGFSTDHLARGLTRVAQRLIHPVALPLLDRYRVGHSPAYEPRPVPEGVTRLLQQPVADPFAVPTPTAAGRTQ